jgi:hypothetical protein
MHGAACSSVGQSLVAPPLEVVQDPAREGRFANRAAWIVNDLKCEDANPVWGTVPQIQGLVAPNRTLVDHPGSTNSPQKTAVLIDGVRPPEAEVGGWNPSASAKALTELRRALS